MPNPSGYLVCSLPPAVPEELLQKVIAIEQASFPRPWQEVGLRETLAQPDAALTVVLDAAPPPQSVPSQTVQKAQMLGAAGLAERSGLWAVSTASPASNDADGPSGRFEALLAFCLHQQILDEMHILQMATCAPARRQGYGRALLQHVCALAAQRGCSALLLEVRRSNLPAVALYESAGFCTIAVRRAYYQDNGEDALIMRCDLAAERY